MTWIKRTFRMSGLSKEGTISQREAFRILDSVRMRWTKRVLDALRVGEVTGMETTHDGWQATAPRDEIRPAFSYNPKGGRDSRGSLMIAADRREGLDGRWTKTLPVQGGRPYRFHAVRRVDNVETPRLSAVARILWQDRSEEHTSELQSRRDLVC